MLWRWDYHYYTDQTCDAPCAALSSGSVLVPRRRYIGPGARYLGYSVIAEVSPFLLDACCLTSELWLQHHSCLSPKLSACSVPAICVECFPHPPRYNICLSITLFMKYLSHFRPIILSTTYGGLATEAGI
jgi:hypothetical protein